MRVNLVSAGPIETPAAEGIPGFDKLAGLWGKQAPLGWDTSDPAPVADAVCFLLSDRARGISGEILHVDGGFHAMGAPLDGLGARRRADPAGARPRRAARPSTRDSGFEQAGCGRSEYLIVMRGEVGLHFFHRRRSSTRGPRSPAATCTSTTPTRCSPSSAASACRSVAFRACTAPPSDSDYGLREFALVDPDGICCASGRQLGDPG